MELKSHSLQGYVRARPTIECAQCGEQTFAPEWSEYLEDNRVRHFWVCDACGYKFETLVRFSSKM
ncbi:MAG TPA: hypothetical protein VFB45_17960 [Pseudolabrys sp.]|nr:hypothetical protein [Pseudolabrys sp.]